MKKIKKPNLPKQDGWTLIHLAPHAKVVKLLAPKVANPNAPLPLPDGRTPVKIAADSNHSSEVMLELLVALHDEKKALKIVNDLLKIK